MKELIQNATNEYKRTCLVIRSRNCYSFLASCLYHKRSKCT